MQQKSQDYRARTSRPRKYMLVRYGRMNNLGLFEHSESKIPAVPVRVVVKTGKGLEMGCVVGPATCYRAGQCKYTPGQIKEYFDRSEIEYSQEIAGKFVRFATPEDLGEERHLRKLAGEELEACRRFARELDLPMKIVDAEHIFGGERVVFYFMADGRVDFRELVKKMAQEYQTRVEMRQIGARDEAKLLGDLESCGQPCCCQRFLKALKPVNMRMAKMQKATLDPAKISGYCGRLKCCLRYEDATYMELKKRLPRKNTPVRTERGEGRVVSGQILTQLILVEYEGGDREAVPLEELDILGPGGESHERDRSREPDRRTKDAPADRRQGDRRRQDGRRGADEGFERDEDELDDEMDNPCDEAEGWDDTAQQEESVPERPERGAAGEDGSSGGGQDVDPPPATEDRRIGGDRREGDVDRRGGGRGRDGGGRRGRSGRGRRRGRRDNRRPGGGQGGGGRQNPPGGSGGTS